MGDGLRIVEEMRSMGRMPGGGISTAQAESRGIGRVLARGSFWSAFGFGGTQVLRFVGNLILWRLLFEEAFGVMALASVFLTGLQMFSDVGIGPSLIQNRREDDAFVNTAWTLQVIRGVAIWLVACVGAYPLARFYGLSELVQLIPLVGFTAVINGFNSSNIFGEQRQVELRRVALLDVGSQLAATLGMVTWALIHPTVWALAGGGIVGSVLKLAGSHRWLPGRRNHLCWDRDAVRALVRFGRWIFISTILTFFAMQSDRLIFGKIVPIGLLGVYSIGQIYATLPSQLSSHVVGTVVFPALSRERHAGANMDVTFRHVRVPILMGAAFLVSCLMAGGPTLIALLYDARATDAGWIIQILAAGSWFVVLEAVSGAVLLAFGRPRAVAMAHGSKVLGMAITIPVGFAFWGFPGAVAGFAVADVFKYVVAAWSVSRLSLSTIGQDVALTAGLWASAGAGLLLREVVRGAEAPVIVEGVAIFTALASFWGVGWLAHRRLPRLGFQPFA